MPDIHMVLQGKGGVGKTFAASVLAQYMEHTGRKPRCIDTDPVNATFHGYKALHVQRLQIMDGDEINPRSFDALIELIETLQVDAIIDNGSSSFVPLAHYLLSNQVPALLRDLGHELVLHTLITGGQALLDTVSGFAQLIKQFPPETRIVVWLNPFWGPIEHEGRSFTELKAYKDNKDRVSAIISIPRLKEQTYGRDLSDMLQQKLTFAESLKSGSLMTRQRLKIIRDNLFTGLEQSGVVG